MRIIQFILERNFIVKHREKTYYVNYLNSDGQILGLLNRDCWKVMDGEQEEINIYEFQNTTKKEKDQVKRNIELVEKLIDFCIKHFNDFQPVYEEDL